jgi:predicted nuclease of predicted toxin-antitoxin system
VAAFLIDESLPPLLAQGLQRLGHDAVHVNELHLQGAADDTVYAAAGSRGAVLVSLDLDFADARRFSGGSGVVVLRLRGRTTRDELIERTAALVHRFAPEIDALAGGIMIIEPGRARIRRRSAS